MEQYCRCDQFYTKVVYKLHIKALDELDAILKK